MGSLFCRSKRSRKPNFDVPMDFNPNEIPLDKDDLSFAQDNQNKVVNGIKLPSGIIIPPAENGKNWIVKGNKVVLGL
jgi:hypothetical protein